MALFGPERVLHAGLLALLLGSGGQAAAAVYCCDDASGRRLCGDVLPAACYDRSYKEMGAAGVRREVPAPLSREEIARRKAEEERRKAEEARAAKQRRVDQALLDTYPTVEDIDRRRDREIAEIERSIEVDKAREADLRARHEKLQSEVEFYKGKALPRDLANNLKSVESEVAGYMQLLEKKQRDIVAVRERYAADRARFLELNARRPAQEP